MSRRGRRTVEELKSVSTADMTPAEYKRSDTPGTYQVITKDGSVITVSGLHSAKVVAGKDGTYRKLA